MTYWKTLRRKKEMSDNGESKGNAMRYNVGKVRLDLIPVSATDGIAEVLTAGANKYNDRNWEAGLGWMGVLASLKRHLNAFERGEDYDQESGLLHIDHVLCNAAFLKEYYKTHPELDDRVLPYLSPKRIGMDVDEVICGFAEGFSAWAGIKKNVPHWSYTYEVRRRWKELENNKDFWMGLKPLMKGEDMPFEPVVYITHRPIPKEWVEDWLDMHRFPCTEVVVVGEMNGKVEECKKRGVERYVDDKYENFVMLNNAGIFTYLWDRPHNRKHDVGYRRITDLKQMM